MRPIFVGIGYDGLVEKKELCTRLEEACQGKEMLKKLGVTLGRVYVSLSSRIRLGSGVKTSLGQSTSSTSSRDYEI